MQCKFTVHKQAVVEVITHGSYHAYTMRARKLAMPRQSTIVSFPFNAETDKVQFRFSEVRSKPSLWTKIGLHAKDNWSKYLGGTAALLKIIETIMQHIRIARIYATNPYESLITTHV